METEYLLEMKKDPSAKAFKFLDLIKEQQNQFIYKNK